MKRPLLIQLGILALCLWAALEFAVNFPYPSPLVRPFLAPALRWPRAQVEGWVDREDFPSSFLEYFGRDPERTIPPGKNLVAPADGVIGEILHRNGISYLVVRMSFWDVHVIRAPAAGAVTDLGQEGVRLVRNPQTEEQKVADIYERGKDAPVQKTISFKTAAYGELKVRMITSYWASRLKVWVARGEDVKKGERIGRILLGQYDGAGGVRQRQFRGHAGTACNRRPDHRLHARFVMPRWLLRDGRLSWGVVGAVVFVTASLIAFDLAWRLVKLPFDNLLIRAVAMDLAAALVVLSLVRVVLRRRRRR